MMLFETQLKKSKPRPGADVPGLAALAKRAAVPDARERAAAIGALLFKMGGGIAVKCANPRAVRPPADDETTQLRKAVGSYINPPIGRALQKIPGDPRDAPFAEPSPQPSPADIAFLHSPEVSNDLRANLIDAVRRRVAVEQTGNEQLMYQWQDSITDLKFAIEDLINRLGPAASALSRILAGGSGGGKVATARIAALQRSAMTEYGASIREGAAVRKGCIAKFYDMAKGGGDDDGEFNWCSYGRTQLHGHFDKADRNTAELWRGTIARAPRLANDAGFLRWGAAMLKKYRLSGPQQRGVFGYIAGSFA